MVFSARTGRKSLGHFCCNKHRRYGGTECSNHYITLEQVRELLLGDIRTHATLAAADRDKYAEYLLRLSKRELNGEKASYDSTSHGANNGNVGVSYSAYTTPAYHDCKLIIKIIENKTFGPSAYAVFETGNSNTFSGYHRFTGLPVNTRMKTRFTKSNVAHPNQMRVSFEINPETAR